MKIAVFGITGRIGSRIAQEALNRGHEVTGISRNPTRGSLKHPRLSTATGTVSDARSVAKLAAGHDAVVSAVGPDMDKPVGSFLVDAARALLDGLAQAGTKRLLVVGGAGSLEVAPGKLLMDIPEFPAAWKALAQSAADALAVYRTDKKLEWTYLSPAGLIDPGTRTGNYRTGDDALVTDSQGKSFISMEDYAVAVLDELEKPRHVRKRFTVAY